MTDLTDLPESMKKLVVHERMGLPVPLVNMFGPDDYDFTVVNGTSALALARRERCGICGERFERAAFLGGERAAEHQVYSDPPMHEDCALAATRLCPHIARKGMRRASDNHVRQEAITPEEMSLDKPRLWMMFVCTSYKIMVVGPEGERHAIYVPDDKLYVKTWQYGDDGALEEMP